MSTTLREFEPQAVRQGGISARFIFSVTCSKCGVSDEWDSSKRMPDDVVRKRFSDRRWLLGRNRAHDLCPTCIGVKQENRLADVFKVTSNGEPVAPAAAIVGAAHEEKAKDHKKTDDLLARHFGKKEPLLAEPQPIAEPQQQSVALDLAPLLDAMNNISTTLADIHAGNELIVELLQKMSERSDLMIAKQEQTIEAVARIAPVIARSTESINTIAASAAQAIRSTSGHINLSTDNEVNSIKRPIRRLPSGNVRKIL